jgi:saccharopine dehydrogenase-like NADP-dependent oxidoreductase
MGGILVLGAGRSSRFLLEYLSAFCESTGRNLTICDASEPGLHQHTKGLLAQTRVANLADENILNSLIPGNEIVVSLLPPPMHPVVATLCLKWNVHFASASYVSDSMRSLHSEARAKGLTFLNELGLDPGIDHLSAMQAMDRIRVNGGIIHSFESYCGGLIHEDDCTENPWKYKFSWNPRNVVLAGQGGYSTFLLDGILRTLPWHRVFDEATTLEIPDLGGFDAYANRDSLSYTETYGLSGLKTMIRGTIRRKDYCKNWQVLVGLGYTDGQQLLPSSINSIGALSSALSGKRSNQSMVDWLIASKTIDPSQANWFAFLDLDNPTPLVSESKTAADLLELVLMQKWQLQPQDRDEVLMYHRIGYHENGVSKVLHSVMRVVGEDATRTAMAKTVGLPLAIGVEAIVSGTCQEFGVVVPVSSFWYGVVLPKLEGYGITFSETVQNL